MAVVAPALAQPGTLFPEPFRIEHQLVQDDGDGNRFTGEPVVDTYGGSWIASERPDGSRLIVDLARRELTEVRVAGGTYWTVSFDRFAELQHRLRVAQGLASAPAAEAAGDRRSRTGGYGAATTTAASGASSGTVRDRPDQLDLAVTELLPPVASAGTASVRVRSAGSAAGGELRRLRVAARDTAAPADAVEVWVDPALRLPPNALAALAAFDEALSGPAGAAATAATRPGRFVAAARAHAGGAVVLRTSRPAAVSAEGEALGTIEDVALRVERLERFPAELAEIPEGLRRVPHPLEATVRFLEEEAERNAAMSGARAPAVN